MLAKPHCGLTPRQSRSSCFAASSIRRFSASLSSIAGVLVETMPSTTVLWRGTSRSGVKVPARGVSYSRK